MIVTELNHDKEAPWYSKENSKGITREKLAARLRRYKVKPEQYWHSNIALDVRGYFYIHPKGSKNNFSSVFNQYLPPENPK
jgi:Protein of unknown function (DUF3631)